MQNTSGFGLLFIIYVDICSQLRASNAQYHDENNIVYELYVISCLHVLAMAQEYFPNFADRATARVKQSKHTIGVLTRG